MDGLFLSRVDAHDTWLSGEPSLRDEREGISTCAPIALAVGELTCLLHSRLLFIAALAAAVFSFRVGIYAHPHLRARNPYRL